MPRVPVSDGVGVVVDAGDRVTRFRRGDRVAGIFNPNWIDGECTAEKTAGARGSSEADGVMAESYGAGLAAAGIEAVVTTPEAAFVAGVRRLAAGLTR